MDYIFSKAKYRMHLLIYLDDILVFSRTLEEHRLVVKEVLEILEKNNLCVKPDKCEFEKDEMEFLGFANFYRRFIKDFAKDSLAITPLTGKKEWKWEERQETAFRSLIDKMCKEPVLYIVKISL